MLTREEIRHFRHCGYLKRSGVLPPALVTELKETILADMAAEAEPVGRDENGRVVRLSQVLDRAPVFHRAATYPLLIDALEDLLGPCIEVVKNRHNHATLNLAIGARDTYHRDAVQWSRGLLSAILYLQDTHLENGCTQIVPGSHLLPGLNLLHKVEEEQWVAASNLLSQAVPVPMSAGDILLMDGLVFHRIGPNHTKNTRMSMTLGYHSADELVESQDVKRLVIVRGKYTYRGNDRKLT